MNWDNTVRAVAHNSSFIKGVVTTYFANESDAFAIEQLLCICAFLCDACVFMINNRVPLDVCDVVQHLVCHMLDRDVTVCVKFLKRLEKLE